MKRLIAILLCAACAALSQDANVVLVKADGSTLPSNSVATTTQVSALTSASQIALVSAQSLGSRAAQCAAATALYSSNYVVTSTVYVQSIGGTPFDPSNQTVRIISVTPTATNIAIVAVVAADPLVTPTLDWRAALNAGNWTNLTSTTTEIAVPEGVTNAAAAYRFEVPLPSGTNAFFRVVDNSTGVSGSGLWWLVYGGIYVDGHKGLTGSYTNIVGSATNIYPFVGGILVEPEPFGD